MITLSSDFGRFYLPKITVMNILCLKKAFCGSALEEDIWVQKDSDDISAIIARHGGRLYIYSDKSSADEVKEFTDIIGFAEIFTEKSTAEGLKLTPIKEFNVLLKRNKKSASFEFSELSLKSLYNGLSKGNDSDIALPPFEDFAPDTSHRLRHGGAVAAVSPFGAGLAYVSDNGGIINGIAIEKDCRRQGFGNKILRELCSYIDGDIFVCASNQNTDFYIKNGFEIIDKAVIAR